MDTENTLPERVETERLVLRPPRKGDGAEVCCAIQETLSSLQSWLPWAKSPPTLESSEKFACEAEENWANRKEFIFQLRLKGSEELVAYVGLHPRNGEVPSFEIGYWCRLSGQGKGYVSEGVRAVTRFAFEVMGADRVEIRCDTRNEASRRVAERCQFTHEAILRRDCRDSEEELRDTHVFALIREEFAERYGG